MTPASWLFIKGDQSIWIERPHGRLMVVAGPGPTRQEHDFPDENALEQYQVDIAERLAGSGWLLWGINRTRRSGAERRAGSPRGTDRRQPLAERTIREA